jgi:ribosomal protein S18 acetylase RimI-like enzyme
VTLENGLSMQIDVRPARSDECEAYVALYGDEVLHQTPEHWRAKFAELETGERTVLVADMDGEMVGGVHLTFDGVGPEEATVRHMVVRPERRRLGIGKLLMDAIEALALARGMKTVRLFVRPDNDPAVALYEARGYAVVEAEECDCFSIDCMMMRKALVVR